ncbi:MAG: FAD-binding oxidoreductase, partial [Pseudomonadota bacterium]
VLEAQRVGWGASGRNGGQIGSGFNWDYHRLHTRLGETRADALWKISEEAKALTQDHIAQYAPKADYRRGIVNVTTQPSDIPALKADAEGDADHTFLDREALAALIGTRAYVGGVLDRTAGFCNPLAYVLGLAQAAQDAGVTLYERSEVLAIGDRVQTQMGWVRATSVLQATNGYSTRLTPQLASRVLPINNYIAVTEPLPRNLLPDVQDMPAVADSQVVVNYFWLSRDRRLIYGGGESYGMRFPKDIDAKVRANLARVYPDLKSVAFDYAWGGTLAVTATRLPYLAEVAPGRFVAGGYSGHGLALSGLCGALVVEAIQGRRDRFDLVANLPVPTLPGGAVLGPLFTNGAMLAGAIWDRIRLR